MRIQLHRHLATPARGPRFRHGEARLRPGLLLGARTHGRVCGVVQVRPAHSYTVTAWVHVNGESISVPLYAHPIPPTTPPHPRHAAHQVQVPTRDPAEEDPLVLLVLVGKGTVLLQPEHRDKAAHVAHHHELPTVPVERGMSERGRNWVSMSSNADTADVAPAGGGAQIRQAVHQATPDGCHGASAMLSQSLKRHLTGCAPHRSL